jgi:hypothetical protein
VGNFYKDKRTSDGLNGNCRDCCRAYFQSPEYKAAQRTRKQSQEYKAADRTRKQSQEYKAARRAQERLRRATDPAYKLRTNLRDALRRLVRNGAKKPCSALDLLGCTVDEFRRHIEAQFQPGMSWDNWTTDGWHIDHKRPLASFDLTDPAQVAAACHYTNLQPLWAVDNLRKGDTVAA